MTDDQDYSLPTAEEKQEGSTKRSRGLGPNIFGNNGPPTSLDELGATPVSHELSLLDPEPVAPNVVSQQQHGKYLLGAIRARLDDDDIHSTLMLRLWAILTPMFFTNFKSKLIDERVNYQYLTNRGISEPEDIFRTENLERIINDLWEEYIQTEKFVGLPVYDRLLAEEATVCGAVDETYLRQLPTEPEYAEDEHGKSKFRVDTVTSDYVQKQRSVRQDPERGADRPVPENVRDNLDCVDPNTDAVPEVISIARERLSEQRFHQSFLPIVSRSCLGAFSAELDLEHCCVADRSDLVALGIEEPEDLYDKDKLAQALTNLKDFALGNGAHVGFYNHSKSLVSIAYQKFGVLTTEERDELRWG